MLWEWALWLNQVLQDIGIAPQSDMWPEEPSSCSWALSSEDPEELPLEAIV